MSQRFDFVPVILSGPIGDATVTWLPDAEHVHLTRLADGTYKAWPMEPVYESEADDMVVDGGDEPFLLLADERRLYVDAPAGGES